MIAEVKKAFMLYPHLYQAKQNAVMTLIFIAIALVTMRNDRNGLDLAMFVFFMATDATILAGVFLRMDYADMMAASPHRKRIAFRVTPLLTWLSLVLCWCLVVIFAYVTGHSGDLYGANALLLIGLYMLFSFFTVCLTVLGGKFNRIVNMGMMVIVILLIVTFFMVVGSSRVADGMLSFAALLQVSAGITPPLTIAVIAVAGILPVLLMLLLLRLTWKRPVRREYLDKLKG